MKNCRVGIYEKAMPNTFSMVQKLALAAEAGYDYLEISIDESAEKISRLDMDRSMLVHLKRESEATGVPIHSMCLSAQRKFPFGSRDGHVRKEALRIAEKAIRFCSYMGIRIIQLAGYDVYYETSGEDTEKYFEENLRKAVEIASDWGVILAFETMETPFMNTVEKAIRYVRKIGSPFLQIYPDIGNVTNGTNQVADDLRCGVGHIVAAHLKETLPGVFRNLQFGEGRVDFCSCVRLLKEMNVGMFVTEFWYDGNSEPLEYLKRNRNFFAGIL